MLEIQLPNVFLKTEELKIYHEPVIFTTVLGSCVAVTFHCHWNKQFLACACFHGFLPTQVRSEEPITNTAKYVDQAIETVLSTLTNKGIAPHQIQAGIYGGSNKLNDPYKIGLTNTAIARQVLVDNRIPIIQQNTGGAVSRKIIFNGLTGHVKVVTI